MFKGIILITTTLFLTVFCVNKSKGNLPSERSIVFFKPYTTEYLKADTIVLDEIATLFKKDPTSSIYLETLCCEDELEKNSYINFDRVTKIKKYLKDKHGIAGGYIFFVDVSDEFSPCDVALVNIVMR